MSPHQALRPKAKTLNPKPQAPGGAQDARSGDGPKLSSGLAGRALHDGLGFRGVGFRVMKLSLKSMRAVSYRGRTRLCNPRFTQCKP